MTFINISLPNFTTQLKVLQNFTYTPANISQIEQAGWLAPAINLYKPMGDVAWLMFIAFTLGIVYIRTNSLPAMAFVCLLLSGLVITFVPTLGAKILYIVVIFCLAGTLWLVFGRR